MELITTNPDWFNQALDKEHTSKFVEVNGARIEYMAVSYTHLTLPTKRIV